MNVLLLSVIFLVIAVGIILFFLKHWIQELEEKSKPSSDLLAWLQDMGKRMESQTAQVDQKMSQNLEQFNDRLDKAAIAMSEVQRHIGEFSEIGRSMKDLQQFLNSPKLRGNLGEQILKELLSEFLPQETFTLQYKFKNGEICDAVIKTQNGLIPIDAKFPMENFRKLLKEETSDGRDRLRKEFGKDIKKHINDISKKYILVEEQTVDYAIMYIPSETIYYEIINDVELYDYASSNRIILVSPMSFYAYLKVILMSFEGQKIESRAKEILTILQALGKDYEKADEALSVLNRHVANAYNQSSNVSRYFVSFGQKLASTKLIGDAPKKIE